MKKWLSEFSLPPSALLRQPCPLRALLLYPYINSANFQTSLLTIGPVAFLDYYIKFPIKLCQPTRSEIPWEALDILHFFLCGMLLLFWFFFSLSPKLLQHFTWLRKKNKWEFIKLGSQLMGCLWKCASQFAKCMHFATSKPLDVGWALKRKQIEV